MIIDKLVDGAVEIRRALLVVMTTLIEDVTIDNV